MATHSDLSVCASCGLPLDPSGAAGLCPACLLRLAAGFASPSLTGLGDDPTMAGTTSGIAHAASSPTSPPTRIGPYRLVRTLGEGGMGIVYLAEQDGPIRRMVALKLIKLGMDTAEVISRFEAERQALALMDHPNIAHVYDAGATLDGRPYFVMEFVDGKPITEFCDAQRFSTWQRVQLFITVCGGIQHAHQKGIIHRDLKPSNILVTAGDEGPVPKIIDFGIAKATDAHQAERLHFTQRGRLIGTPEYMSPEQADSGAGVLDTRADIYALGVILYELLAGALPFAPERLRGAAHTEMLRILKEEDPPSPSSRVSTGGGAMGAADRRSTTLPGLASELRGDLDWITLKAIDKDRARRYSSASELAADLARSIANEPVTARPPSAGYRLQKFVRRNRLLVASAAAVALAVIGGLIVSTTLYVQAGRAERAERAQREEAERQRGEADRQRSEAERQRGEAALGRQTAEAQTALAATARADADAQRTVATDALATVEHMLYYNNISLASRELADHNISYVDQLLAQAPDRLRNWEWHHLRAAAHMERAAFRTHDDIETLALTADGTAVVTVRKDRTISTWDMASGRARATVRYGAATDTQGAPVLSTDGRRLLARSAGAMVSLIDTSSGRALWTVERAGRFVRHAAVSADAGVIAAVVGGAPRLARGAPATAVVELWDGATGTVRTTPLSDVPETARLLFSPDGRRLIAQTSSQVIVIDVASGAAVATHTLDAGTVTSLFASDATGVMVPVVSLRSQPIHARFSPSGELAGLLRTRRTDQGLEMVAPTGEVLWSLSPSESTGSLEVSRDGLTIVRAGRDRTISIADALTGRRRAGLAGHARPIAGMAISADGTRAVSIDTSGQALEWRLPPAIQPRPLALAAGTAQGSYVRLSPDHRRILFREVTGSVQTLRSWSLSTGRLEVEWSGGATTPLSSGAYSPDGTRIALNGMTHWDLGGGRAAGRYRVVVLDAATGAPTATLDVPGPAGAPALAADRLAAFHIADTTVATALTWSHDGRQIWARTRGIGLDPPCRGDLWDLTQRRIVATINPTIGDGAHCQGLTWIAPDRALAQVTNRRDLQTEAALVHAINGRMLWRAADLGPGQGAPFAVTRDTSRLARLTSDGTVQIRDVRTGVLMAALPTAPSSPVALAFSPDGSRLAGVTSTGAVAVWDPVASRLLLTLPDTSGNHTLETWTVGGPATADVRSIAARELRWSPDGGSLITTTISNTSNGVRIDQRTWRR